MFPCNVVKKIDRYLFAFKTGWSQSYPEIPGDGDWDITLTSGQVDTDNNFGNYQQATKSGYKFHDINADGVWDPDGVDNISGNADDEVGLIQRLFLERLTVVRQLAEIGRVIGAEQVQLPVRGQHAGAGRLHESPEFGAGVLKSDNFTGDDDRPL